MLKTSSQIVIKSSVALMLLLCMQQTAMSKDFPMQEKQIIHVPTDEWAVLDFPFKIESLLPTVFFSADDTGSGSSNSEVDLPIVQAESEKKGNGQQQTPSPTQAGSKPFSLIKGENAVQIFAKQAGSIELVVWGGNFPVMVKIKTSPNTGDKYIRFVDSDTKKADIARLESGKHEVAIEQITKALWSGKTPTGYQSVSRSVTRSMNELLKIELVQELIGSRYKGETWNVKNTLDKEISLHEESFLNSKEQIFSVCLEANRLKPGETARVFLVRAAN